MSRKDSEQKPAAVEEAAEAVETTEAAEKQAGEQQEQPQQEQPSPQEKELEQLRAQLEEERDRYLRLMAEFGNYRRRTTKEKEAAYPDAVANVVKELLPVVDNFQRALEATCGDENYRKGVEMTYEGLMGVLRTMGLEEFGEVGEAFDANIHNAMMHIEDENLGKNVVSQVFQKGYRIGERVLRYAMVQTAN